MFVTTFSLACNSVYYVTSFLYGFVWILHIVLPFVIDIGIFGVVVYHWTRLRKPDHNNVIHIFGPEPGTKESELHPQETVRCIAHRGAGLDAPENTLQAFKYCVENECGFVELDVRLSRDGQLVLLHDEGLERLSGTDVANIRTVDWETIKNVDVGATHPNRLQFKEVRLCLLDDALEYLLSKEVRMIIDVKGESQQMVNEILTVFASRPVLYKYAVVTTFNPFILYQIRRRDPKIVGAISYRPYCFSAQNYDAENGPTNPRFGDRLPLQMAARGADVAHALLWRWSARWCAASAVLVHKDIVSPFLATGETYASLEFNYRISASYISRIVAQVLASLRKNLVPIFLPVPTENHLKQTAEHFWNRWNCPNCFGAIDGKHVRIKCPKNSGSIFFNYKDYYSTVLLAIVDANCKFIAVDVGSYGKEGDSGIFKKSAMGKKIMSEQFNVPQPAALPGTDILTPHYLVGDDAFGLDVYMMKPYYRTHIRGDRGKAIFNYRICRARRVTENSFGLLSQVFRILYSPIAIRPEICDDLITTLCCLHNLLRDAYLEKNGIPYYSYDKKKTKPTENMLPLTRTGGFRNIDGFRIRNILKDYFTSEAGKVSWQEQSINRMN